MTNAAYLDIETTGLCQRRSQLTVVGIAVEQGPSLKLTQLIDDQISEQTLADALQGVERLYTYNGSRFDLPFIRSKLNFDLCSICPHTDLMYHCWRQNLKGGLKNVERLIGIKRQLPDVDGYQAVQLWWQFVNNADTSALETLLAYNREDVINLQLLRRHLQVH